MSKRRAVEDEWDLHRDEIVKLYVDEDKPLSEVISTMDSQGFERTKAQYERAFKRWEISKNATAIEWKYIVSRLQEREKQQKPSAVIVRSTKIPEKRIQKQRRRHEFQPTYDRCLARLQPDQRLSTPPGVSVVTPKSSPSPTTSYSTYGLRGVNRPRNGMMDPSTAAYQGISLWQHDSNQIDIAGYPVSPNDRFLSKQITSYSNENLFNSNVLVGQKGPTLPSQPQSPVRTHRRVVSIAPVLVFEQLHWIFSNPQRYLPTSTLAITNDEFRNNPGSVFDLVGSNSYLDTLRLIVAAVGNNFAQDHLDELYNWLSLDQQAHAILGRLIDQNSLSAQDCAQRLLRPAVRHGNHTLVSKLLSLGVNVNHRTIWKPSALVCAVENEYEDIVDLLLDHGANDWHAETYYVFFCAKGGSDVYIDGNATVIDLIVGLGYHTLLEKFLSCESRILGYERSACLSTLCLAIYLNRLDILLLIIRWRPDLWQSAKRQPWLLLEAAACCEDSTMLDYLLGKGFEINATDSSGFGSALAAACAASQVSKVQRLIAAGANIGSIAFGFRRSGDLVICPKDVKVFNSLRGQAALHMAIRNHQQLMKYLLEQGADPNQLCGIYPLQLAASIGNEDLVDLLLKNGANINAKVDKKNGVDISAKVANTYQEPWTHFTAIYHAFQRGHAGLVRTLYNNGALLPLHPPIEQPRDCTLYLLADAIAGSKTPYGPSWLFNDEQRLADDWDPCATAIVAFKSDDLRNIMKERYMMEALSYSHLSHCIITHGAEFTQEIFRTSLLCMDPVLDSLILCSLIYAGDEKMAIDLVSRRVGQGSTNLLLQEYGTKALIMAVSRNHIDLARTLIEFGIDPFSQDHEFCPKNYWRVDKIVSTGLITQSRVTRALRDACSTGFHTACRLENTEMVKLFLSWQVSPSYPLTGQHRDHELAAACVYAVCSDKSSLERMFQGMGIDFQNSSRVLGSTHVTDHLRIGLQYAMYKKEEDLARCLIDLGADPHAAALEDSCQVWHTPLQCAAKNEQIEFIERFLSMGADPNEKPAESAGATAIQFAAIRGNFEILKLLIEAGGDINAPGSVVGGRTAIQGAAEHGRLDMTRHLLELGAEVRGHANKNYIGAVWLALQEGHRTLACMIQDWKRENYGEDDCEDFETIRSFAEEEWNPDYPDEEEDSISGNDDED